MYVIDERMHDETIGSVGRNDNAWCTHDRLIASDYPMCVLHNDMLPHLPQVTVH